MTYSDNIYISKNLAKRSNTDPNELFTFMIGGAAGDGIMSTGNIFIKILAKHHYHCLLYTEYPSLIRGGHNTVMIRVGKKQLHSQVSHIDLLFAINLETIEKHIAEVTEGGIVVYDPVILRRRTIEEFERPDVDWRPIPLKKLIEEIGAARVVQNTIGVGAVLASVGLPAETYKDLLTKAFSKKPKILDVNMKAVDVAYQYVMDHFKKFRIKLEDNEIDDPKMIITGNQAITAGLIAGGLGVYCGYPMAPSSTILETVMKYAPKYGYQVLQTEDEIAAIVAVIGANHAGARAATATSGGGMSLMVEAIGLAATTETPLVIINVMRPGPSTGLPTWTGQGDLLFTISMGQDTFPRIVLAPGDVEECYYLAFEALNYAEEYQLPVIVLTDKWLGSSYFTYKPFKSEELRIRTGKTYLLGDEVPEGEYQRFKITDDGVSPRAIPGNPSNMIFRTTGNEHDESGIVDDTAPNRIDQMDKRWRKMQTIREAFPDPKVYGYQPEEADVTFFTWGSNKGIILDLMNRLSGLKTSMVMVTHMWPFPAKFLTNAIDKSKLPILMEQTFDAQFGQLIRNHCLRDIKDKILRYDGRPFDPVDLERIVLEIMNKQ